jgi:MoaA/NifB/PqqE/SkfB family radical SAM enzyme
MLLRRVPTPPGPLHLELDINDRCNVDCYFCNAMDVRTKEQVPYNRVAEILNEAAANGLQSVRFSGGGDPLFHREIERVIDFVHAKNLVIDNITTNGVALRPSLAEKLINGRMREILISLNASDSEDYARMMQVKPATFDKVVANIGALVASRGEQAYPCLVVQFLFDRDNYTKMVAAYDLGRRLGADVIAINAVLEIPRDRIQRSRLLQPDDAELLRPYLRQVIEADRDAGLREMYFELQPFNRVVREIENELGITERNEFPTAPSFREENGGCFFGYYSAIVRGNGDMHPCCLMMNPDYPRWATSCRGPFPHNGTGRASH